MNSKLTSVTLDDKSIIKRTPEVEHERRVAIADLLEENHFAPKGGGGPYHLFIRVAESRLFLHIRTEGRKEPTIVTLALKPFKTVIRDYFMICESYFDAIKHATTSKIETLDMARRGIHNEGSDLLKSLLKDKIDMDFDTARRLFTLICVLHIR